VESHSHRWPSRLSGPCSYPRGWLFWSVLGPAVGRAFLLVVWAPQ